jgi:hypothetical protein
MSTRRPKARASAARQPAEDPVVREVHAIRRRLLKEYGGDYAALTASAEALTRSLGIKRATDLKPQKLKRIRRRAS